MKIFVHYEPIEAGIKLGAKEVHTMKAGLPKSWYTGPVSKVKSLFVDAYKSKHGIELRTSDWRIVTAEGKVLEDDVVVETVLAAGMDVRFKPVSSLSGYSSQIEEKSGSSVASSASEAQDPSLLACKRYGCLKKYKEQDNSDEACRHHTAPPCFNDVRKWWACCTERVAYDWDEFMKIEGCASGRHSTEAPGSTFAPSPRTEAAASSVSVPVGVKSIDSFNESNPDAVTAAASVAKTVTTKPKAQRREADGWYRCMNKGCSVQWFDLGLNCESACVYHSGAPVFHDGGKSWSCCAGKTAWSFEEFMAIPGCTTGAHDPGLLPETA